MGLSLSHTPDLETVPTVIVPYIINSIFQVDGVVKSKSTS